MSSLFPFSSPSLQILLLIYIYLGTEKLNLKLLPIKSLLWLHANAQADLPKRFCCFLALELTLVKIFDWVF